MQPDAELLQPANVRLGWPWQISGSGIVTGFFERQTYKPTRERNEPDPRTSFYYVLRSSSTA